MKVVDGSVVAAALLSRSDDGVWAEEQVSGGIVVAPHLLHAEVANVLRRAQRRGDLSADAASLAHASLLELPVRLFGYRQLGGRVWELRENLTSYDGWYVALAEALNAPLATLDRRIAATPGVRCEVLVP